MIRLRGVRQNNLKGFDLDLPLGRLTVVTGLSGSGKSSLAFDTLYAEGQRRYIETFSPYARQFFDRMDKPAVDRIENIPPAIAIEQRNSVRTSRSTVGTMTEVCEHLKVLWTHLAQLHCRGCGQPVRREPPVAVWESLTGSRDAFPGRPDAWLVTFDLPLTHRLPVAEQLALLGRQGFHRVLADGKVHRLEDLPPPAVPAPGAADPATLVVVVDRVTAAPGSRSRFIDACEQAYRFGRGRLAVRDAARPGESRHFSTGFHCAACDIEYPEPSPSLFSFNNPVGACPECKGFGRIIAIDPTLALPDTSRSLAGGVVKPWQTGVGAECQRDLVRAARKAGVPLDVPFRQLDPDHQAWVMDGEPGYDPADPARSWPKAWYGVRGYFRWLEGKAYKMHVRVLLSRYRSYRPCPACHGARLRPEALLHRLPIPGTASNPAPSTRTLGEFLGLTADLAADAIRRLATHLDLPSHDPVAVVLQEVRHRLEYLVEVGLGYLTLDRTTRTLSGGETARVNLTACLGSRLVNTLYVLDEPTVGLHPRDTGRLIGILERLRDAGNTLVVVEHEPAVMRAADLLVDLGPGQGESGGRVVYCGTLDGLPAATGSLTADHLTGRRAIPDATRRPVAASDPSCDWLRLTGVRAHNLCDLSVDIPLGRLVCVSGVSGSGKTTLVREVLLPLVQAQLADPGSAESHLSEELDGEELAEAREHLRHTTLTGVDRLGDVVLVDQSSLGRTPRSTPAVYLGAFDDIREVFAASPAARELGLKAGAFSFNSAAGQCELCRGAGFEKIEMQFLSDVYVRCPACNGSRYREHVLQVRVTGPGPDGAGAAWSIADILGATVDDAIRFLDTPDAGRPARRAAGRLRLLSEVGLGYLRLGQPLNTLSGGESQRLKLVSRMEAGTTGRPTLFLFDEPTTGLHPEDVRVLLGVFQRLVDAGHSVVVVEHHLDVIRSADWVIDIGPEAGNAGGRVVVAGTPEGVAACAASHTGHHLRAVTPPRPRPTRPRRPKPARP